MLKPEFFCTATIKVLCSWDDLEEAIWSCKDLEPLVQTTLDQAHKEGSRKLPNGGLEWEEKDSLIYHQGCLYIPNWDNLRQEVLCQSHDALAAGHPGQFQMMEEVHCYYWRSNMDQFVCKYVSGCRTCAQGKPAQHPKGPLQPLEVPKYPWQIVGVDLVGPLPLSDGFDMIITYVDLLTKQAHFLLCNSTITAEGVADMHVKRIFPLHGTPEKFISDRGPQFAACTMLELYQQLGIEHAMSSVFHPQSNGQTEQMNQEIVKYLRMFCSKDQQG
jgi:hypothetical protein